MGRQGSAFPFYVIKALDLASLNFLDRNHPRPKRLEWINRGTDQLLRPTSVEMLIRTLFRPSTSPSVARLHDSSGLRVWFAAQADRDRFAAAFAEACARERELRQHMLSAVFDDGQRAEQAVARLAALGVPKDAISLLWRTGQFLDHQYRWDAGHSNLAVAGAVASGGLAGALLSAAILTLPAIGPVVVAGMFAVNAVSAGTAMGGVLGATGGAIAKMLTDHDVDGVAARAYEEEIRRGKVFVAVDTRAMPDLRDECRHILRETGGHTYAP